MAEISIRSVTKSYDDTVACRNVSLEVENGQLAVLLGPSGAGKTTLLKTITGELTPDSGEIFVSGQLVSSPQTMLPPARRHLGAVMQEGVLWPHLTVEKHLELVAKNADKVGEILELLSLDKLRRRYPDQLSGGEKQRLSLARALAAGRKVLLLDEPLANLDRPLVIELMRDLQRLRGGARARPCSWSHTSRRTPCSSLTRWPS
ncbi:MAG: ABC transporter ATP-binding protein [Planctomycetota bacterium]|nr:ABC transporter ATP-binding protein [Planctomycetota bacterium]